MKIGIFDSGIGGLLILKSIRKKLPKYDFVYLGDLKNLPYGNKSDKTIYELTEKAVDYLFKKQNCQIVILACNTASAKALRKIQRKYLPKHFSERRVLGVIVPTIEKVIEGDSKRIGVLGTKSTIESKAYEIEIHKRNPKLKVFAESAPSLVSIIENNELQQADDLIHKYTEGLINKKIDSLVLGCTHYPLAKKKIERAVGNDIKIYSQDEIIPAKLRDYLERHPEQENKIDKKGKLTLLTTDTTPGLEKMIKRWMNTEAKPKLIEL